MVCIVSLCTALLQQLQYTAKNTWCKPAFVNIVLDILVRIIFILKIFSHNAVFVDHMVITCCILWFLKSPVVCDMGHQTLLLQSCLLHISMCFGQPISHSLLILYLCTSSLYLSVNLISVLPSWRPCSASLQNDKIWTKKLRCLWSNPAELTADDPSLTLVQFLAPLKTVLFYRVYETLQ